MLRLCHDSDITINIQPRLGWSEASASDTSRCFCHYHVIIPIMRPGSRLHRMICPMSDPEHCQDKCVRYPGPVTSSQLAVNALWRTSAVCAWCNPVSQLVIHSLPWSYVNCSQSGCFNCTHTPARGYRESQVPQIVAHILLPWYFYYRHWLLNNK